MVVETQTFSETIMNDIRKLLDQRQQHAANALERIKRRVKSEFSHELEVDSIHMEDIFGGIRCCRLCEVIPVNELNWFSRLVGKIFPGPWLNPLISIRVGYPGMRVGCIDNSIYDIAVQELHQLVIDIKAKGVVELA